MGGAIAMAEEVVNRDHSTGSRPWFCGYIELADGWYAYEED